MTSVSAAAEYARAMQPGLNSSPSSSERDELDESVHGEPVPPVYSYTGDDLEDDYEEVEEEAEVKREPSPELDLLAAGPSTLRRGLRKRRAAQPRSSYGKV